MISSSKDQRDADISALAARGTKKSAPCTPGVYPRRRALLIALCTAVLTCSGSRSIAESLVYAYDVNGRLLGARPGAGYAASYQYDKAGNRIRMTIGGSTSGVAPECGNGVVDLDRDGFVTLDDREIIRAAYGAYLGSAGFNPRADIDCSGGVDFEDYLIWHRAFPAERWLPGDWTSSVATEARPWWTNAPDGIVDFHDLAVIAREWGRGPENPRRSAWLDLAPGGTRGAVDKLDVLAFRSSWLLGRVTMRDPLAASPEPQARADSLLARKDFGVEVRSRDEGRPGAPHVSLGLVVTGRGVDIAAFQFQLHTDLRIAPAPANGAQIAATPVFRLASGAPPSGATYFCELRPVEGGYLISGAFLDLSSGSQDGEVTVCSLVVPRSDEIETFAISDFVISSSAGDMGRISDWSGAVALNPVPSVPVLLPNWPNPFNPATTIRYAVPTEQHIRLRVFDLRGRQVRVLVDEVKTRGWQEARWDGRADGGWPVASGVYCYELEAGRTKLTGKMSVVR